MNRRAIASRKDEKYCRRRMRENLVIAKNFDEKYRSFAFFENKMQTLTALCEDME